MIDDLTQSILDNIEALKHCLKHHDMDGIVSFQFRLSILNTEYGQILAKEESELGKLEAQRELKRVEMYSEAITLGFKTTAAVEYARVRSADLTIKTNEQDRQLKSLRILAQNLKDTVSSAQTYIGWEKTKKAERV